MKSQIIKILRIIIPIGIGFYLTGYFFSGLTEKELQQTKDAFFEANYFWVIASLILAFLSHLSRAYRWLFLLEPMGYKPKFSSAYHAVMSGYVINYTVPRSGEIARAGLLMNSEKVPFEKGFATIVIERVIDVLMLGLVVFISGLLQANSEELDQITRQKNGEPGNLIWYLLGGAIIFGIAGLILYLKNVRVRGFVQNKIQGFWEGMKSIWIMKRKWIFLLHTFFIWTCYVGMIWVSAQAFPQTANMPAGCVFAAFIVGAVAIAAFPGGLGAYPLWVNQVLSMYKIEFAGFGIFTWVIQTVLIIILGLLSLFLIQRQPKRIETNE